MNCAICKKHKSSNVHKIYENENIVVFHGPITAKILGYCYIEFKRHIESWAELTEEELHDYSMLIQRMEVILSDLIEAERVYTVVISEAVRHLHIHVIPRTNNSLLKGIELIQQATQQSYSVNNDVTEQQIDTLVENMRILLKD